MRTATPRHPSFLVKKRGSFQVICIAINGLQEIVPLLQVFGTKNGRWNGGTFQRSKAERSGTIFNKVLKMNKKTWNDFGTISKRAKPRSAPPVSYTGADGTMERNDAFRGQR